jgi:hypothetical protein
LGAFPALHTLCSYCSKKDRRRKETTAAVKRVVIEEANTMKTTGGLWGYEKVKKTGMGFLPKI